MNDILNYLSLSIPELTLLSTAVLTLLVALVDKGKNQSAAFFVACFGLLLVIGSTAYYLGNETTVLFQGLLISDQLSVLMKLFIAIAVLLCLIYSRHYLTDREMPAGDYYVLALFSTLGMMTMVSANNLLTLYLGLELLSLPLYAMTSIRRSSSDSSEAGMKYFVMGAIASGMLLYGMSLVYAATGQLDLFGISSQMTLIATEQSALLSFALVFIVAGVGFKLASIPFHMWAPDVYVGAPTSVTLFISAAPKIAAIGMALRLLTVGLLGLSPQWQKLILVLALLSTGFGNILAIVQTNIKRMLAYSAISHSGFALFGILAASRAGYAASLYYVLIYALMTTGAFGLIVLLSSTGREIEAINDLKGLNKRNPWLAFMMLIILFSLAGVPPTVGFFIKLFVLKALVDAHLTWVAVVGLAFAVIGAFYYLRVIKVMYFDTAEDTTPIQIPSFPQMVLSLNCLSLLYFGLFPTLLVTACFEAFLGS